MSETAIRLSVFAGALLLFAALETLFPARARVLPRARRWVTNLSLSALGSVVGALMAPVLAVTVAAFAQARGWGLLNVVELHPALAFAIAFVALDFAVWAQHVATHRVPLLWRLHKVHHTDRDLDVTSGVRFHPVEIGVSLLWKALVILALGPSVLAVLVFEVVLNATALFTHSNIALPPRVDRAVRTLFVTPDMHRIHHSVVEYETNANFGFNLSVWDRLFGTYRAEHEGALQLGLLEHQTDAPARLLPSLALPLQPPRR